MCVDVERHFVGDERRVEGAELVADASEAEEDEAKCNNSEVGDSISDPTEVDDGLAGVELEPVGAENAKDYEQTGSQDEAKNPLDQVEAPVEEVVED